MQKPIDDYFQYRAAGAVEDAWGFHLSAIGSTRIRPGLAYPPPDHPAGRAFDWETGRVLPALQLVFVRRGAGQVEWRERSATLRTGTVFLLLPGEWHRYAPDPETGWTEEWFELRGPQISHWMERGLFKGRVFPLADPVDYWRRFRALHARARRDRSGSAGALAGLAMSLLADAIRTVGARTAPDEVSDHSRLVGEACGRIEAGCGVAETARALGVSYPTLHRRFQASLGMSPKTYADQMRRARAEALLTGGLLTIKEIAAELGYHSASHFSHAFKRVYGVAPREWRRDLAAKR